MRLLKHLFCALIIIFIFFSCSKPKPYIKTVFEGKWEDISVETYLWAQRYTLSFRTDSFYVTKFVHTDVYSRSNCHPNPLDWYEYYSGLFKYDNDSIYLTGFRTDSINERLEISECVKKVEYNVSYKYEFRSDTLVLLPREGRRYNVERLSPDDVKKHERILAIYLKKQ
ncbi:MAG: hypothetical protein ABSF32_03990 [Ignavibacteria bacterium]|jgi:hypothetical protein